MPNKSIYFPDDGGHGYYDKALQRRFNTKREKREFMNRHGFQEDGSMENPCKRKKRLHEFIEESRRNQGLRPRTMREAGLE